MGMLFLLSPVVKASSCANPITPTLTIGSIAFAPGVAPNKETVTLNGSHPLDENNVAGFYSASSTIGAFYSIWQIAGRLCFSLSRSSLLVSRGEHDHILIVAVAGLPRH